MATAMSEHNPEAAAAVSTWLPAGLAAPAKLAADWLAVAAAMSLPWSTSLSGILIALWLIVLLTTLDFAMVRREVLTPEGGLPVLLWGIAALGMLWADVAWKERFDGLGGFHKLLMIPLLLAQFRRSAHGRWVVLGFCASAAVLLVLSWGLALIPGLPWRGGNALGVPVKDYIAQSEIFAICAFGLLGQAAELWRQRRRDRALLLAGAAAIFVANVLYVATGRTTLVIMAVLLLLLGLRQFGWKGVIGTSLVGVLVAGVAWTSSSYLRARVNLVVNEVEMYSRDSGSSTGLRLDFWKYSIPFIVKAPVVGHGTGMIEQVFERARSADPNIPTTRNPHGQILTVGIQLGLLGTTVLFAMWLAHFALFHGPALTAWLGLTVVASTVVGSLFNSHVSDFTQGWIYVFGVGVVGAMARRADDQVPGF
jgi:O-antigen ligase